MAGTIRRSGSAIGRSPGGWYSWSAATTTSAPARRPAGRWERSPDSASTPVPVSRAAPPSTAHTTAISAAIR
ncbi:MULTISPECIES: hypothetical protein [unclassified Streptomyces]|uniref:hypothetical protein n=1 Tax=unclassified Streptomyces TaxID=2593676 RepID=UPI002B1D57E3|nr:MULTISPECIES: hypothetical protein [unclassified Streptomyces]